MYPKRPEDNWDTFFLGLALEHASMSKDPSTKVGAVLVGPNGETLLGAFNGFPRGVEDTYERWHDRTLKYSLVVHAEENIIATAACNGIVTRGKSLYFAAYDALTSRLAWGAPPCVKCSCSLIQAGITQIVTYSATQPLPHWQAEIPLATTILREAGVIFRLLEPHGEFVS